MSERPLMNNRTQEIMKFDDARDAEYDRQAANVSDSLKLIQDLKYFLATAPVNWQENQIIRRYYLNNDQGFVSCVFWNNLYYITGTDIVKACLYRMQKFGRKVIQRKKFEEGIFSDLRTLRCGVDATLEQPKSPFLSFLFRNMCLKTQKKQKVFFWFSVRHDKLFADALERDLRRESNDQPSTTKAVSEPALSFKYDSLTGKPLYEQVVSHVMAHSSNSNRTMEESFNGPSPTDLLQLQTIQQRQMIQRRRTMMQQSQSKLPSNPVKDEEVPVSLRQTDDYTEVILHSVTSDEKAPKEHMHSIQRESKPKLDLTDSSIMQSGNNSNHAHAITDQSGDTNNNYDYFPVAVSYPKPEDDYPTFASATIPSTALFYEGFNSGGVDEELLNSQYRKLPLPLATPFVPVPMSSTFPQIFNQRDGAEDTSNGRIPSSASNTDHKTPTWLKNQLPSEIASMDKYPERQARPDAQPFPPLAPFASLSGSEHSRSQPNSATSQQSHTKPYLAQQSMVPPVYGYPLLYGNNRLQSYNVAPGPSPFTAYYTGDATNNRNTTINTNNGTSYEEINYDTSVPNIGAEGYPSNYASLVSPEVAPWGAYPGSHQQVLMGRSPYTTNYRHPAAFMNPMVSPTVGWPAMVSPSTYRSEPIVNATPTMSQGPKQQQSEISQSIVSIPELTKLPARTRNVQKNRVQKPLNIKASRFQRQLDSRASPDVRVNPATSNTQKFKIKPTNIQQMFRENPESQRARDNTEATDDNS